MGVYIKDMTMPGSCWECELLSVISGLYIGYVCECTDLYIDNEIVIEGRPDWCPLEEIEEE